MYDQHTLAEMRLHAPFRSFDMPFLRFFVFLRCRLFFPLSVISCDNNTSSSTNKICGTYRSVCHTGNTEKILFVELRNKYIFYEKYFMAKNYT